MISVCPALNPESAQISPVLMSTRFAPTRS